MPSRDDRPHRRPVISQLIEDSFMDPGDQPFKAIVGLFFIALLSPLWLLDLVGFIIEDAFGLHD